jgi:hypothetical protein
MVESWAYDFACDQPLAAIAAAFSAAGSWQWQVRESTIYGDYLNCRPAAGIRLRVHEYPQTGAFGTFTGLQTQGFAALIELEEQNEASRAQVDGLFRLLLQGIGVTDLVPIEPYD